jgi:LysM repeat protein
MSAFFALCRRVAAASIIGAILVPGVSAADFAAATHAVTSGDTLYSISRQYGLKVDELCAINGISQSAPLKIGQTLALNAGAKNDVAKTTGTTTVPLVHTAQKGDTFYSIARNYNVTVTDLLAANALKDGAVLKVDQKLKIPGRTTTVDTATAIAAATSTGTTKSSGAANSSATAKSTGTTASTGKPALWPVTPTKITYVKGKITGVQLATADRDTVKSVSTGTVTFSGEYRGFGEVVFVKAARDYVYVYTGLGANAVKTGDKVSVGTNIGTTGTGDSLLTFMVYRNGSPVDPATAPRA